MQKVAILLTCHNRKDLTLKCLSAFYRAKCPDCMTLEVFLVDDGSTDGTSDAINKNFPDVNIVPGTGNLFWNKGMRLAWESAVKMKAFDFYVWLNDDTIIDPDGLERLFNCYNHIKANLGEGIVTAACRKEERSAEFSYGGRTENGSVIPNGEIQECKYINGNFVLIPKEVYNKVGMNSLDYTHGMGDFDYGLSAQKVGFKCCTTPHYIATCPPNEGTPAWSNPNTPIIKRFKLLYSPRGLNFKEYLVFRKKFWGWKWVVYAAKAYCKVMSPRLYSRLVK